MVPTTDGILAATRQRRGGIEYFCSALGDGGIPKLARQYRAKLTILVCRERYQNVHGVDEATVERMRQQWQE